jgi:hypothetical protein
MSDDDDLRNLTDGQLQERHANAERQLDAAVRDYTRGTGNLTNNPQGSVPSISLTELKGLDNAIKSAEQELRMVAEEQQRRSTRH